jgi:cell division cycle 20, cofactor of APC complex
VLITCTYSSCPLQGDRYIPQRNGINLDQSRLNTSLDSTRSSLNLSMEERHNRSTSFDENDEDGTAFKMSLAANLLNPNHHDLNASTSSSVDLNTSQRILGFRNQQNNQSMQQQHIGDTSVTDLKVLYTQNKGNEAKVKVSRHIPSFPDKILDAPGIVDDYYLNILDWSHRNVVAIALGPCLYLWNADSGSTELLMELNKTPDDFITSLSWIKSSSSSSNASFLAIGTSSHEVQLWDTEKRKQVRSMKGHTGRVSALSWSAHILSSGSSDALIFHHDVRVKEHHISTLKGHTEEICGLSWSPDGTMLASGANDNRLMIWENDALHGIKQASPRHVLTQHIAAVKALAWCPWQRGLLASGGGTADKCIKLWDARAGALLQSVDTNSQVCSLLWSVHEKELLSSHGFSLHQLTLWKYPQMTKIKELTGHTARVLHMSAAPDGATVVSASADETLRFWRVFGEPSKKIGGSNGGSDAMSGQAVNLNTSLPDVIRPAVSAGIGSTGLLGYR